MLVMRELLTKKSLIESYLAQRPRQLSSLSFVNMFLWSREFSFDLQEINQNLCVFASHGLGTFMYFPPLGKEYFPQTIDQCFAVMQERNRGRGVSRIENVSENELTLFSIEKFLCRPKSSEYLYSRAALAALQGQDYKSKRHEYNLFQKKYAAQYQAFAPEMIGQCGGLYDRWAAGRRQKYSDEVYRQMLAENQQVHRLGMEYFQELGLVGRVVLIGGEIVAYTFGYALTEEIFCVLFEVADLQYHGLPVYIFTEFCRDPEIARFPMINVMDDFGVKNLEKTKLSFRPAAMIPSYTAALRSSR